MRSCHPFEITVTKRHWLRGVCETDIRDSYMPSPMVALNPSWSPHRTRAVPLSILRLTRRWRD